MCDYCDCRLVPAIADLTADHERLLGPAEWDEVERAHRENAAPIGGPT